MRLETRDRDDLRTASDAERPSGSRLWSAAPGWRIGLAGSLALVALLAPAPARARRAGEAPDVRSAVPPADRIAAAEGRIREVHRPFPPSGARAQRGLARTLRGQAAETADDVVARYALLAVAAKLAAQAGDVAGALEAAASTETYFAVPRWRTRAAILEARELPGDIRTQRVAAEAGYCLSLEISAAGDWELAAATLAAAEKRARAGKDESLLQVIRGEINEVRRFKAQREEVERLRETPAGQQGDPAASLAEGRYRCMTLGDWEKGLPLLARGSDPELKEAAERDLSGTRLPESCLGLGDTWWRLADRESGRARDRVRRRAAQWYGRALTGLAGFNRSAAEARVREAEAGAGDALPKVRFNSAGMRFELVPSGNFLMGDPGEPRKGSRGKQETQAIERPFYLGAYEVTGAELATFAKETGYRTAAEREGSDRVGPGGRWFRDPKSCWRTPGFDQDGSSPVVCVTWGEARAFCDWLGKKEGRRCRLPTEAEWEHACRAGKTGRFGGSNSPDVLKDTAWCRLPGRANPTGTLPSGSLQPNPWGLFDMLGNAAEWCDTPPDDDRGQRVHRGGSWLSTDDLCRPSGRWRDNIDYRNYSIGFRVLLET